MWLAVPIVATTLASLWTGWRGLRARRAQQLDTAGAMLAHRHYLDALTIPARSSARVPVRDPAHIGVVVRDHVPE